MQEMAKGCAGSLYSPVWVGSSREKFGVNTDLGVVKGSLSLAHPFFSAQIQSHLQLKCLCLNCDVF